jgi:hypothetical protein
MDSSTLGSMLKHLYDAGDLLSSGGNPAVTAGCVAKTEGLTVALDERNRLVGPR